MKAEMLPQLEAVTHALYLREHAKVRDVLADEARIRAGLAKLDQQILDAREAAQKDASLRAVGADLLWQAWEERTRRTLNIELAQVMARKLEIMDQVRLAFGKKIAVQELTRHETQKRRARQTKLLEARLLGS